MLTECIHNIKKAIAPLLIRLSVDFASEIVNQFISEQVRVYFALPIKWSPNVTFLVNCRQGEIFESVLIEGVPPSTRHRKPAI